MNVDNYVEMQYRELQARGLSNEFEDLYQGVEHKKLRDILSTLHYELTSLFRTMNERLPTTDYEAHFWADPSRDLIFIIEMAIGLFNAVKDTKYAFEIDSYYDDIIRKCRDFLCSSGGSTLPKNMAKIELYYVQPIFKISASIVVDNVNASCSYEMKQIGEGSYANVYRYKDAFYNHYFVVKRAKKDLSDKELERFKREFEEMNEFSSPYILDVYRYNADKNEYIMEYMDFTLDSYIEKNNDKLTIAQRKSLLLQVLRAFEYIHSKQRLHRDISPKNILIKNYDDIPVIKISDFGLVKIPDSNLTTVNTECKGYFNDQALVLDGFDTYNILHETYALTRIVVYIITGKTNVDKIKDKALLEFVQKGLNVSKKERFQNVSEMIDAVRKM